MKVQTKECENYLKMAAPLWMEPIQMKFFKIVSQLSLLFVPFIIIIVSTDFGSFGGKATDFSDLGVIDIFTFAIAFSIPLFIFSLHIAGHLPSNYEKIVNSYIEKN